MNYITIESNAHLCSYLKRFEEKGSHVIALDIEAESNLHAYGERLCLVQIFDGANKIIVDPFSIDNSTLKIFFENTKILKVMYDAGSDLSLLKNTADIEIKSIMDLRPAVELLDYDKKDLHSMIAFEIGIFLEKKRKFQKYNWTKRPLSEQAIDYALNDVAHLLTLKDIILAKLYTRKSLETYFLKNMQIQCRDYTRNSKDKYRKISGYCQLRNSKKIVFRRIFDIREKYAKLYNMPPNNVIKNACMIDIVNDPKVLKNLWVSRRIGAGPVQDMLQELREATEAT